MTSTKAILCNLKEDVETIVERLGGPSAVARRFDISDAAVQQWKVNGLPELRKLQISLTHPEALAGTRYEVKDEAASA